MTTLSKIEKLRCNKVLGPDCYSILDSGEFVIEHGMSLIKVVSEATGVINEFESMSEKSQRNSREQTDSLYVMLHMNHIHKNKGEILDELYESYIAIEENALNGGEIDYYTAYLLHVLTPEMKNTINSTKLKIEEKTRKVNEIKDDVAQSGGFDLSGFDDDMILEYRNFENVLRRSFINELFWDERESVVRYYDERTGMYELFSDSNEKTVAIVADMMGATWGKKKYNDRTIGLLINSYARQNAIDPATKVIELLPEWDGIDRIAELASKFDMGDGVIEGLPAFEVCLKKWIQLAIGRILYSKNPQGYERFFENYVLIIGGKQGAGKSSLANYLAGPFVNISDGAYQEISFSQNVKETDRTIALGQCVIGEVSEIDRFCYGVSEQAMKADITARKFRYRPPYGKYQVSVTPYFSLIGTWNPQEGGKILKDASGNRRYLTFELGDDGIDWSYSHIDIFQVWAQAKHLFENEAVEPSKEFKQWQEERNMENTGTGLDEILKDMFDFDESHNEFWYATDIISRLKKEVGGTYSFKAVASTLRRCGAVKATEKEGNILNNNTRRAWVNLKTRDMTPVTGVSQDNMF